MHFSLTRNIGKYGWHNLWSGLIIGGDTDFFFHAYGLVSLNFDAKWFCSHGFQNNSSHSAQSSINSLYLLFKINLSTSTNDLENLSQNRYQITSLAYDALNKLKNEAHNLTQTPIKNEQKPCQWLSISKVTLVLHYNTRSENHNHSWSLNVYSKLVIMLHRLLKKYSPIWWEKRVS